MNLNINLATRVYVNFKQVNLFLVLSFLLCFVWMTFNAYLYAVNLEQMDSYAEFTARKGKEGSKTVSDADYSIFLTNVKNTNNILYKHSYDWLTLLENLEKLVPSGISLRSLEPSNKGETLRLTGTAIGFSSVRTFIENLEASKEFTEVYLTDQANVKNANNRHSINFSVTCKASIL